MRLQHICASHIAMLFQVGVLQVSRYRSTMSCRSQDEMIGARDGRPCRLNLSPAVSPEKNSRTFRIVTRVKDKFCNSDMLTWPRSSGSSLVCSGCSHCVVVSFECSVFGFPPLSDSCSCALLTNNGRRSRNDTRCFRCCRNSRTSRR